MVRVPRRRVWGPARLSRTDFAAGTSVKSGASTPPLLDTTTTAGRRDKPLRTIPQSESSGFPLHLSSSAAQSGFAYGQRCRLLILTMRADLPSQCCGRGICAMKCRTPTCDRAASRQGVGGYDAGAVRQPRQEQAFLAINGSAVGQAPVLSDTGPFHDDSAGVTTETNAPLKSALPIKYSTNAA